MNKPAKLLAAIAVLAFAAAGLYYAWLAPARKGGTTPTVKLSRQDQVGPKATPEAAGRDLRELPVVPADPVPAAAAPAGVPVDAFADAKNPSAVPNFTPVTEPIKPLPADGLPGFTPAPAGAAAVITAKPGAAPGTTATAAPTPGAPTAPTTSAPPAALGKGTGTAPAATTSNATPAAGAQSPLPPLPAPAAPTTPAAKGTLATAGAGVTPGKSAVPPASPAAPPVKPSAGLDTYTVKEGDSIAGIWASITGSERGWERMLEANPGVDPSRLKIGQVLKVPPAAPARTPEATPVKSATGANAYTVESGDTLHRIANKVYGDSRLWKQIYEANKSTIGSDPAALKVGTKLQIPPKSGAAPKTDKPEAKDTSKPSVPAPKEPTAPSKPDAKAPGTGASTGAPPSPPAPR